MMPMQIAVAAERAGRIRYIHLDRATAQSETHRGSRREGIIGFLPACLSYIVRWLRFFN